MPCATSIETRLLPCANQGERERGKAQAALAQVGRDKHRVVEARPPQPRERGDRTATQRVAVEPLDLRGGVDHAARQAFGVGARELAERNNKRAAPHRELASW